MGFVVHILLMERLRLREIGWPVEGSKDNDYFSPFSQDPRELKAGPGLCPFVDLQWPEGILGHQPIILTKVSRGS